MQDFYMEGWLVVWVLISLFGLAAILLDEGLPGDSTGRFLLVPMVAAVGAYLAVPLAPVEELVMVALE